MNELKEIKLNKLEKLASDYEMILREELNIPIATKITYSIFFFNIKQALFLWTAHISKNGSKSILLPFFYISFNDFYLFCTEFMVMKNYLLHFLILH